MVGGTTDELQPYAQHGSVSNLALYQQLYEGLTTFDKDGAVQYVLAESMEPNETLDTWTIHLREGVKLHNGEDFTATDVQESLQAMLDPAAAWAFSSSIDFVDPNKIKVVDEHTLELELSEPVGPLPELFAMDRILMRSTKNASEAEPVGTGPYQIESFTPGQEAKVVKFDDYWGEKATIDEVTLAYFQELTAVTNALHGGQIDVAHGLPFTEVANFESDPSIELLAADSAAFSLIGMRTDIAPLNDPRVREALRLVIDREKIVSNAYGGYATVANDFVTLNTACDAPEVPQRKRDISHAKQLLKEAGVADLSLELVTNAGQPGMLETAQLFAQQAAEAGIDIQVNRLDTAAFLNEWTEWPFYIGRSSSPYIITATNHFSPGGSENASHFDDKEYNDTVAKLYETSDPAQQCELIGELQQIEYERGPYITPAFGQQIVFYRNNVHGLEPSLYGHTAYDLAGVTVD
ncbi:ABC transporter substrate-binding protein [Leucobacter sp. HY1910]